MNADDAAWACRHLRAVMDLVKSGRGRKALGDGRCRDGWTYWRNELSRIWNGIARRFSGDPKFDRDDRLLLAEKVLFLEELCDRLWSAKVCASMHPAAEDAGTAKAVEDLERRALGALEAAYSEECARRAALRNKFVASGLNGDPPYSEEECRSARR